jgi:SAM-dependent methyltransferase
MAHEAQRTFVQMVKDARPEFFDWTNVIEIGSLNINGTVRDFFTHANYVGFDVGPGPCVDYAIPGQDVKYPDNSFDVAITTECFEHAVEWPDIWRNMIRMLKPGGLIVMTCAGTGRPEHGTSRSDIGSSPLTVALGNEYYKNLTPADFTDDLREGLDVRFYENTVNLDLYAWGIKNGKAFDLDLDGKFVQ